MTKKQELIRLEKAIIKDSGYIEGLGLSNSISKWDEQRRERIRQQLERRRNLLNEMFLCTAEEVEDFKKTNDRLYTLTRKMHEKALGLYRAILQAGYDPEFDDDIMVEGTLRYVFNDVWSSVILTEKERRNMYGKPLNPYESEFPAMLEILSDYYESGASPECAFCHTSYDLHHKPEMDAKEFGLENFLDDGESWAEGPLRRKELEDICICHAVHDLCDHKMYAIPDLLRMNDFWCEVKITHQLLSDRDGNRDSYIEKRED